MGSWGSKPANAPAPTAPNTRRNMGPYMGSPMGAPVPPPGYPGYPGMNTGMPKGGRRRCKRSTKKRKNTRR